MIVLIICITVLAILWIRTRAKINSGEKNDSCKSGTIFIIIGILLIIVSVLLNISMLSDSLQDYMILRTISLMTSEPLRAAIIAAMLIGITTLIAGIRIKWADNTLHLR